MKDEICEIYNPHGDIIDEVKKVMPSEDNLLDVADLFKVFGDSTRTKILAALFYHDLCVCDICRIVGMEKSAVSHQLRILRNFNLVKFTRNGKEVIYSLADDHVKQLYRVGLEHINEDK